MPKLFQSACNQEQQVQEGTGFSYRYKSFVSFFRFSLLQNVYSDPTGSDLTYSSPIQPGPTRSDHIRPDPTLSDSISTRTRSDVIRDCSVFVFRFGEILLPTPFGVN